jgi:ribonuclease P protein component
VESASERVAGARPARFARSEHVRRRSEYTRIYDRGAKVHSRYFTLFALPNELAIGRLGIAATRKLGGAVVRNKAKRLIREVFRHNKLAPGFDVVVVPKPDLLEASLTTLEAEFRHSVERARRRRKAE